LINTPHTPREDSVYRPKEPYTADVLGPQYAEDIYELRDVEGRSESRDSYVTMTNTTMHRSKAEEVIRIEQQTPCAEKAVATDTEAEFTGVGGNLGNAFEGVDWASLFADELEASLSIERGGDDEDQEDVNYFESQESLAKVLAAAEQPESSLLQQQATQKKHRRSAWKRTYPSDTLIESLHARVTCYGKRRMGLFKKVLSKWANHL